MARNENNTVIQVTITKELKKALEAQNAQYKIGGATRTARQILESWYENKQRPVSTSLNLSDSDNDGNRPV